MIAQCLIAPTTVPTTEYVTTERVIATSSGREPIAHLLSTLAQIIALVMVPAPKSSAAVSVTRNLLGSLVTSGFMLLMDLSLILVAITVPATESVSMIQLTTRLCLLVASALRTPNRRVA